MNKKLVAELMSMVVEMDDEMITKMITVGNGLIGEKKSPKVKKNVSSTPTPTPKKTRTVGNLEQDGKYVRTVKGAFMNSKVRYAIKMSITEDYKGTKLGKGDKVYDELAKKDKYVQVYEFKTVKDANAFMDDQAKRLA